MGRITRSTSSQEPFIRHSNSIRKVDLLASRADDKSALLKKLKTATVLSSRQSELGAKKQQRQAFI
jgi:hypothetical protein